MKLTCMDLYELLKHFYLKSENLKVGLIQCSAFIIDIYFC